jgi:hypothetical protein
MSQGGIGHWLNKRREPGIEDMNRVLRALGLEFLEVALVIREPQASTDDEIPLTQKYNPYFRYPVSDWREPAEVRDGEVPVYGKGHFELSDYHARSWWTLRWTSNLANWSLPSGRAATKPRSASSSKRAGSVIWSRSIRRIRKPCTPKSVESSV